MNERTVQSRCISTATCLCRCQEPKVWRLSFFKKENCGETGVSATGPFKSRRHAQTRQTVMGLAQLLFLISLFGALSRAIPSGLGKIQVGTDLLSSDHDVVIFVNDERYNLGQEFADIQDALQRYGGVCLLLCGGSNIHFSLIL